jgi:hypothetical protein
MGRLISLSADYTNTGGCVASTGTFYHKQKGAKTFPKGSQQISTRRRAITRGDSANITDHLADEDAFCEENNQDENSESERAARKKNAARRMMTAKRMRTMRRKRTRTCQRPQYLMTSSIM